MANLVEVAVNSGKFPTLVEAVKAAGLVETLSGVNSFTVFAPTEQAFATALTNLGMTAEELLGNVELLKKVLLFHVVPGKVMASDVMALENGTSVQTVGGQNLTINNVDGVKVNNANVVQTDIEADNGVIHVIDTVLLPQ